MAAAFAPPARTLRACSSSFDEDSEECENGHVSAGIELSFAVFPKAAGFFEPAEGALDDPPFGQDCERMEFIAFDDYSGPQILDS